MIKKVIATFILVSGLFLGANAQDVFTKGDNVVNVGIGLGSYLGGTNYTTTVLPISGSFEHGIVGDLINGNASIGIGGYLAYTANKYKSGYDWGFNYSYFILGARGVFHYQFVDRLDTYAGLMLGYNIVSASHYGTSSSVQPTSASRLAFSTFIGARYYFTENIAAFAELGYGIAALQLGVAIKL